MKNSYLLTNPLSIFLDKPKEDFTREDLLRVIQEKQIERITFHYTALDGKLKELKIPIPTRLDAEIILTEGERADGSSLFKGLIDSGLSDLYIVPVYKSAFLNPFYTGSLDFVCRYLNAEGEPASFTPDNILGNALRRLKKNTGMELHALGELEFYLFLNNDFEMYIPEAQGAYHTSAPYSKTGKVLAEMLRVITQITGNVKYAHSEVGYIHKIKSDIEEINGKTGEQLEIELLPSPVDEAADNMVLAKWLIRNIAYKNGMLATFAPKLEAGNAGNGLHIHMKLMKDGQNMMVKEDGSLSENAHHLIGGLCRFASTITAFGNTVSSSYLRLVPNQEAPTKVCWSDSNRSSMVRVPLGWSKVSNLASIVNPGKVSEYHKIPSMQTVELRTADGSANVHLLLAAITTAVEWGLTHKESGEIANKLYIKGNIQNNKKLLTELPSLPPTCFDSAELLLRKREEYEKVGLFPPSIINYQSELLKSENDTGMRKKLARLKGKEKSKYLKSIMHKDIHRH